MATNKSPEMSLVGDGEKDAPVKDVTKMRTASGKACFACRQMKVGDLQIQFFWKLQSPFYGSIMEAFSLLFIIQLKVIAN
jgi:hypothetical protein